MLKQTIYYPCAYFTHKHFLKVFSSDIFKIKKPP